MILRLVLITLTGLYLGGFTWFVSDLDDLNPSPQETDCIVVFTGGSNRMDEGFRLLQAGYSKNLLISGVNNRLPPERLKRSFNVTCEGCDVQLDRLARNTKENAIETSKWMREKGYQSVRLVTANYHIQRSKILMRKKLPDVDIIAHPVQPDSFENQDWWYKTKLFSLIVREYNKLLFTILTNF